MPVYSPTASTHSRLPAGEALGEVLNFLLQLGFREVGAPFAVSALRAPERGIAADLAQLGLLLPFRRAYVIKIRVEGLGLGARSAAMPRSACCWPAGAPP